MKRISYLLVTILVFAIALTVDAKYRKYEIGDVIEFNGHYFVVIEDSDENSDKLKVIDGYNVFISNYQDLKNICIPSDENNVNTPNSNPAGATRGYKSVSDIKCVTENAVLCFSNGDSCTPLNLPFETDDSVDLTYNENRETNIGYFIKNRLVDYYKSVTKLNDIKVRLLTADEQIAIVNKYDMAQAGTLINKYGTYKNQCGSSASGLTGGLTGNDDEGGSSGSSSSDSGSTSSIGEVITGEENYNWLYPNTAFWVNSLKYTASCWKDVEIGNGSNRVSSMYANELSGVRPVLELSKKEFTYPITKEVEGSGTLTLDIPENTYDLGDIIYINEREWMVLGESNGEVRLIRTKAMSISNANEVKNACGIDLTSSSFANNLSDETVEKINCAIPKFKYCKKADEGCKYIYLPYNYGTYDYTYDPSIESNVGHYITNELNAYLEEDFGLTNLRPTVMTIQEVNELKDQYGRSSMFGSLPENVGEDGVEFFVPGALYPVLFRKGFIKNYNTYEGSISTNYYNYVKPVVTVSKNDLVKIVKAGQTVKAETMPSDGWELVELKVTTAENGTVVYTPETLVKTGLGTYTFTMPASATHVFAKFIEHPKYNVTSKTDELVVDEGLNRDEGDNVTFRVTEPEGQRLDKIIYYDEEDNVIEVEVTTDDSGDYIVTVPNKNVVVEAIFVPLFNLTGVDVVIPVSEGVEGEKLTFTVTEKENYVVTGLRFTDGKGGKITPYYTVIDGVYSVIMPASNVHVEVDYHADQEERPIDEEIDNVPKTGDDITKYIIVLGIGTFILIGTTCLLKTRIKKQEI